MRMSTLHAPTLREVPADAETVSHRLMLKAGMIRQSSSGTYTWLHLGQRALQLVAAVVREEMDAAGAQEVLLPVLQPAELWHRSGRWLDYGPELLRVRDRQGREYALGPTHEEIITDLVQGEIRSYRQLPVCLYQVNTKFRDEVRPRFGVMRAREFLMKDAYSFDRDRAGMETSYARMHLAYRRIFARLGLDARPALADAGAIGGTRTHEFIVSSDTGEVMVVSCPRCDYLANVEQAEAVAAPAGASTLVQSRQRPVLVPTPGARTVAQVTALLGVQPSQLIKTMLTVTPDGGVVAALVRGDHELCLPKLARALGLAAVTMAGEDTVRAMTGTPIGFAGPLGLRGARLVADLAVAAMPEGVAGANAADAHLTGVRPGTDFAPDLIADIRLVGEGEPCPVCGAPLRAGRGIEVGHIFQLGTKYSEAFAATFSDQDGRLQPMVMGCYGIGISRTVAAMVEEGHDERGIVWPLTAAPYTAAVLPVNDRDDRQREMAERLYEGLRRAGVAAILDDRAERAGVKFKDADLLGWPLRLTVGSRAASTGEVELTERASGKTCLIAVDGAPAMIAGMVRAAHDALAAALPTSVQ